MDTTHLGSGNLAARWAIGVAAIISIRLAFEHRLPGGAATGLAFAAFMFLWIPTVPAEAYRAGSPYRRVLYSRLAFFLLAAAVGTVGYQLLVRMLQ